MKCYAAGYCKLYNTDKCTNICDFKIVLDALYSLSNIPKRYRQDIPLRPEQTDLQSFHYLKDYKDHIGNKLDESEFNSTIANYSTTEQMNAALAEKAAKSVVDGLVETVGTKAAQSDLTALQGTVSTLSETVGTKAAQSDLNNAVGRIETAEGAIKTLTETTVPGINGAIDAVEKDIADEIAAREAAVKAEKEAREAADNAQVDRIAALEALLTWQPA